MNIIISARALSYVHPECGGDLSWVFSVPDGWLFTASWDYRLMARMLAHALFTIPDAPGKDGQAMLMLPNPVHR